MKKSLVKIVATSAVALTLAGASSVFAAPANVDVNAPVFHSKADAEGWAANNQTVGKTLEVKEEDGLFYVVDTAAPVVAEDPQHIGSPDEKGNPAPEDATYDLDKAEDPFGTEDKVIEDAQKNAFENVGRHFPTLKEAVEAYPNNHIMYDPATGDYVAFTDVQGQKAYTFASVQDAVNAFPNLSPIFEDGVYRVYTDQAPRLQYAFATEQEAYEAFGFDANPMYDAASGKYLVYTNALPKLVHEFNSYEEAMAAFPGSFPMYANGKYYVFTTYEKIAGTNGTVKNPVDGKLQDDEFAPSQEDDKKPAAPGEEDGNKPGEDKPGENKPGKDGKDGKDGKKAELPQTGEASTVAVYSAALLSVLAGFGLVSKARKDA